MQRDYNALLVATYILISYSCSYYSPIHKTFLDLLHILYQKLVSCLLALEDILKFKGGDIEEGKALNHLICMENEL